MNIIEIASSETFALRNEILRPGQPIEACHFSGDDDASTHHFGCYLNDQIVGVVSIYKCSKPEIQEGNGYQIRAMATSVSVRGRGVGLALLKNAEQAAFDLGADYVWANARTSAIGFYKKAGYTVGEDEFEIIGVGPHYLIWK